MFLFLADNDYFFYLSIEIKALIVDYFLVLDEEYGNSIFLFLKLYKEERSVD